MRMSVALRLCPLVFVLLLAGTSGLCRAASETILHASNFSSGPDGWVSLVHGVEEGRGQLSYKRERSTFHHYAARQHRISVEPDAVVKYEAEVNIPTALRANSFWLWLVQFDTQGQVISQRQIASPKITRTEGWQKIVAIGKTSPGTTRVELRMSNWGVGDVHVRSVTLSKPVPGSFDYLLAGEFAGTLQEKKILHDWSLRATGAPAPIVSLAYENLPAGASHAVRAVWQNAMNPQGSFRLMGAVEDPRWPRPPRKLASFSLRVRAEHLEGNLALRPLLTEVGRGAAWQGNPVPLADCAGEWKELVFRPENFVPGIGHVNVTLTVEGGKGRVSLQVADIRLRYEDGSEALAFQEWKDLYWYYPKLTEPVTPRSPDATHRIMHGAGTFFVRTERGRHYLLKMKEAVPNLGIQSLLSLEDLLAHRRWFAEHDMALGFQNATPYLWQAAVERDALSSPVADYAEIAERHHKIDYTSEAWRDIYREVAARFKAYGIPEYQLIDGHYITKAAQSDRHVGRILKEGDAGVLMAAGRRIHFWDYFESYTGARWTPAEVGLKDWSEYTAAPKSRYTNTSSDDLWRKRGYLDMALRHYDYMRWHADVGGIFKEAGVTYFLMNNGDDWNSANDWLFNVSTAGIAGFVEETYFYHPNSVLKAYPLGLAFRDVYARSGTHHRLIAELGKGGHGPIYWAPEIAYAITFTITASKPYQSLEIDWPDETDWETQTDPNNRYHHDRFCSFLARAYAYNDATLDRTWELAPAMRDVVSLQETTAMYAGIYREKLGAVAEQENHPLSRVKGQLFDYGPVRDARLLINDNYALPAGMPQRLLAWLDSRPDRILVLHGASAGRRVDGTNWSQAFGWENKMNAPGQFAAVFGSLAESGKTFSPEKVGAVLLQDEDGPLLSRYTRPSGARVYYYHRTAGQVEADDRKALQFIYREAGIRALADTQDGNLAVYPFYDADGGIAVTAFNRKRMNAYKWSHATAAMQVKAFPWTNDGDAARFRVPIDKPGDYLVLPFLAGGEKRVTLDKPGFVELEMNGINAEVIHVVPAGNERRIDEIRKQREAFFRWLDQRLQPAP